MSKPLIKTSPESIFCNPSINLIVVVLPLPLGPIKASISPSLMEKETFLSICFFPKLLHKLIHSNNFFIVILSILSIKSLSINFFYAFI